MQKAYSRQNFHNGTDPALDEVDMNKIDQGLDVVDDRVIELDMTKANKTDVLSCVAGITYSISTGIMTITQESGAVQQVNFGLNNVALSMSPLGVITMEDSEGNTYTCDLREIINSKLSELQDVDADNPTNGQVLQYNGTSHKWEAADNDGGTAVSYEAQTLTTPQKAQARENIDAPSVEEAIQSNPNLLDNPFFTVNERGQSSYSVAGYTVNRFRTWTNDVTVTPLSPNGITIANSGSANYLLTQHITAEKANFLRGKKVTLSLMLTNGDIIKATDTVADSGTFMLVAEETDIKIRLRIGSSQHWVDIYVDGTKSIDHIKLELGSTCTIALDTPNAPSIELAKCQTSTADVSVDTYTNKGNLVTSNSIAPTEDGATASQAYAVGSHFFRGGDYCTCIQAIAQNGTFTLNTNYKVTTLSPRLVAISATTDASGNARITSTDAGDTVVGFTASCYSADAVISPFYSNGWANWALHVADFTGAPKASYTVSGYAIII